MTIMRVSMANMPILRLLLYIHVALSVSAYPDLLADIEIEEASTKVGEKEDNRSRAKRHDYLPPAEFGLVRVPPRLIPYLPMYNSTHANMSRGDYLLMNRGPKHLPTELVLPISFVYILIFLTGLLGNTLVAIVIANNSNMHSATNFYLFSLAVSDLMLLLLGLPNDLSVYWQQYPYPFGEIICRLRALASEMGSYCSVLVIVAFSMERYLAVCKPLESYQISTLSRACKIIGIAWLVSFSLSVPIALYTSVHYLDFPPGSGRVIEESAFCAMLEFNIKGIPVYETSAFIFLVVPLFALSFIYWKILRTLNERQECATNEQGLGIGRQQAAKQQRARKAIVRMLGAVVICFFLCWAPFHFQRLFYIHMTGVRHYHLINEWLYYTTGCTYYISTTVNPILYTLMSTKYRKAFRDALCCRFKNRNQQNSAASAARVAESAAAGRRRTGGRPHLSMESSSSDANLALLKKFLTEAVAAEGKSGKGMFQSASYEKPLETPSGDDDTVDVPPTSSFETAV